MAAHDAIVGKAKRANASFAGMGTTVTAVALVAGYWVIAHIGDSRANLLRDGHLSRITCDHSYVQHLINTGRIITPSEEEPPAAQRRDAACLATLTLTRARIFLGSPSPPRRPLAAVLRTVCAVCWKIPPSKRR